MSEGEEQIEDALLGGRYRLGPCVGRGGSAIVYRAEDAQLARTVAIKLLRKQSDDPAEASERVHGETDVRAGLRHPSLVALYEAQLRPGHPQYLVMEFVDGPTLAQRIAEGALRPTEVAAIGHDLADALRLVHEAGIIHRDVKPSNVLLAPADRPHTRWRAKLADFGVAASSDLPHDDTEGTAVGTAEYLAPEQVRSAPLGPATDIYSLGLVLLEALTGEPAYRGASAGQTALARLTVPPAVPDALGAEWASLLRSMTDDDPAAPPTAAEVVAATERLSEGSAADAAAVVDADADR